LEASIGWSYRLLDPGAQGALRALSVLPGRFSLDAAVTVIGGRGRELLEALVDHSLVLFRPEDGRYVLLDTIRPDIKHRLHLADHIGEHVDRGA
jgi:hypothetical protein